MIITRDTNVRSNNVAERLGFVKEGHSRECRLGMDSVTVHTIMACSNTNMMENSLLPKFCGIRNEAQNERGYFITIMLFITIYPFQ